MDCLLDPVAAEHAAILAAMVHDWTAAEACRFAFLLWLVTTGRLEP